MSRTETLPFDIRVRPGTFSRLAAEADRLGTEPHLLAAALIEAFLREQRAARRRASETITRGRAT